jgi:ribonucleoside-triphosphate reductase (formate)
MECGKNCEVYSRIVGYFRPVSNWNIGKKEEFKDRIEYANEKAMMNEFVKEDCGCTITKIY